MLIEKENRNQRRTEVKEEIKLPLMEYKALIPY
jgi:hypothetical protein